MTNDPHAAAIAQTERDLRLAVMQMGTVKALNLMADELHKEAMRLYEMGPAGTEEYLQVTLKRDAILEAVSKITQVCRD